MNTIFDAGSGTLGPGCTNQDPRDRSRGGDGWGGEGAGVNDELHYHQISHRTELKPNAIGGSLPKKPRNYMRNKSLLGYVAKEAVN